MDHDPADGSDGLGMGYRLCANREKYPQGDFPRQRIRHHQVWREDQRQGREEPGGHQQGHRSLLEGRWRTGGGARGNLGDGCHTTEKSRESGGGEGRHSALRFRHLALPHRAHPMGGAGRVELLAVYLRLRRDRRGHHRRGHHRRQWQPRDMVADVRAQHVRMERERDGKPAREPARTAEDGGERRGRE